MLPASPMPLLLIILLHFLAKLVALQLHFTPVSKQVSVWALAEFLTSIALRLASLFESHGKDGWSHTHSSAGWEFEWDRETRVKTCLQTLQWHSEHCVVGGLRSLPAVVMS